MLPSLALNLASKNLAFSMLGSGGPYGWQVLPSPDLVLVLGTASTESQCAFIQGHPSRVRSLLDCWAPRILPVSYSLCLPIYQDRHWVPTASPKTLSYF